MRKWEFSYNGSIGNVLVRHSIPAHWMSNGRRGASNMLPRRIISENSNFKVEINTGLVKTMLTLKL